MFCLVQEDIAEAVTLAGEATHIFVFAATSASEGEDRPTLGLNAPCQATYTGANWWVEGLPLCGNLFPDVDQDDMIAQVLAAQGGRAGAKTAVVAVAPGALLTPWRGRAAAVLTPLMPGQAYGLAIASILFVRRTLSNASCKCQLCTLTLLSAINSAR